MSGSSDSEQCPATWLGYEGARCQLKTNHEQTGDYEHYAKIKWLYENGEWGRVEVIWRSGTELNLQ